jgi:hypothetical protein
MGKKDEDQGAKNGILSFGDGGANKIGNGDASLLDRNANIFSRISQTYQDKQARKIVGRF